MSTTTLTPNYSTGNDRFDAEAATWDSKPEVVLSSKLCLEAILAHSSSFFPRLSSADVLEVGCGTGLLTVPLAQHVGSVLALDTSQGMIGMLDAKVQQNGLQDKVQAKVKLLEDPDDSVLDGKRFDVVFSHLVFHHVPDMAQLVKVMFGTLKQGGRVWISDFEDDGPQAEAFHPKDKVRFPLFPLRNGNIKGLADDKWSFAAVALALAGGAVACRRGAPRSQAHRDAADPHARWLRRRTGVRELQNGQGRRIRCVSSIPLPGDHRRSALIILAANGLHTT